MTKASNPTQEYYPVPSLNGHAPEWLPLTIEGIAEGYEINVRTGAILAPKFPTRKNRTEVTVTPGNGRNKPKVQLRQLDGKYRSYPIAEIHDLFLGDGVYQEELPSAVVPKKRRRRSKAPATTHTPTGGVEMLRVYRYGGISLTVNARGKADLSKAKNLTPADVRAIAELAAQADEMNKFMGL